MASSSKRVAISTSRAPKPGGPYCQALRDGRMVFISGQLGFKPESGDLIDGGIVPETELTFSNIKALLEEAGAEVKDLVKVTILLKDLKDFEAMNEVYSEFIRDCPVKPARTTFQAGEMPRNSRIEVDAIAIIPEE